MLEIRSLSKSFGGVKATDNVTLDFADGSLTAVIGPNGAGKSMLAHQVERFARAHDMWRITTHVMDNNKQAMIEADEFDMDTMMVMFTELRAKQIRADAEVGGGDALSHEMRRFIEEAKASGVTRCPIRDIEEKVAKCPVDLKTTTPQDARAAVERLMQQEAGSD